MDSTIEEVAESVIEWGLTTFKEATAISCLRKLEKEILELDEALVSQDLWYNILEEYADCFMCLLSSAARQGFIMDDIKIAMEKKMIKNLKRKWEKNDDNTYSHI